MATPIKDLTPFKALDHIKSEEDLDGYVDVMVQLYSDDASRYNVWRDAMVAGDGEFNKKMAAALPPEVGRTRRPTAAEWDAAIDAVRKAK